MYEARAPLTFEFLEILVKRPENILFFIITAYPMNFSSIIQSESEVWAHVFVLSLY